MNMVYTCSTCSTAICDQIILRIDGNYFHSSCLICSECQRKLDEHRCYARDGKLFCKEDFFKYETTIRSIRK